MCCTHGNHAQASLKLQCGLTQAKLYCIKQELLHPLSSQAETCLRSSMGTLHCKHTYGCAIAESHTTSMQLLAVALVQAAIEPSTVCKSLTIVAVCIGRGSR